jgi:hypothetical protein
MRDELSPDSDARAQRIAAAHARRVERRLARASAPAPQRVPRFEHLSLPDVRELRRVIADEEERAAYWRRVIQARLAIVRDRRPDTTPVADLRGVLTEARGSPARTAALGWATDKLVVLPDLAEVWSRPVDYADAAATAVLESELGAAEGLLTAYRLQLHGRIDALTSEVIVRYREAPNLALDLLTQS